MTVARLVEAGLSDATGDFSSRTPRKGSGGLNDDAFCWCRSRWLHRFQFCAGSAHRVGLLPLSGCCAAREVTLRF